MENLISHAASVFRGFSAIMNAVANTPVFPDPTSGDSRAVRRTVARKAMLLLAVAITGCSIPGQKDLHIATGTIGTQFRTGQMERIFSELGYQQEALRNPATGVVDKRVDEGPWIVLMFSAKALPAVHSKVWVNRETGLIKLYFREEGARSFSPQALELYQALKDRMALEFGAGQVKEL